MTPYRITMTVLSYIGHCHIQWLEEWGDLNRLFEHTTKHTENTGHDVLNTILVGYCRIDKMALPEYNNEYIYLGTLNELPEYHQWVENSPVNINKIRKQQYLELKSENSRLNAIVEQLQRENQDIVLHLKELRRESQELRDQFNTMLASSAE